MIVALPERSRQCSLVIQSPSSVVNEHIMYLRPWSLGPRRARGSVVELSARLALHRPDWKTGGDQTEEVINTTSLCSASDSLRASQSVDVRVNRSSRVNLQRKETTCDA